MRDLLAVLQNDPYVELLDEHRLKVDLLAGLETTWIAVVVVALCMAAAGGIAISGGLVLHAVAFLVAFCALGFLAFYLKQSTDIYYIFDRKQRQVIYQRTFMGRSRARVVTTFEDIVAVAVDCIWEGVGHNSRNDWKYSIVLVQNNRKLLRISDLSSHRLSRYNASAKAIAAFIGTAYHPGGPRRKVRPAKHPENGDITINHVNAVPLWVRIVTGVGFVLLVALLVAALFP